MVEINPWEAMLWLPYLWVAKLVKAHSEFMEDLLIGVEV